MESAALVGLRMAGAVIGFPLLSFAFGSALLKQFHKLDDEERWAASWGVGFAFLAVSQLLAFVTGSNQTVFNSCTALLMLAASALCHLWGGKSSRVPGPGYWWMAVLCLLSYVHLVCIQALLPIYAGSWWYGDWWMHYDEALVFRGQRSLETKWFDAYTLASRTPLFNLVSAWLLSLAGDQLWVFQLASALMNCCFVSPAYLVLRELFGARAGKLGIILASLNVWMLHMAWYPWPKMLVVYFLLLALYFYLRSLRLRRTEPQMGATLFRSCWASALLGFMTHQVALVYLAALLLHAAFRVCRDRAMRPGLKEAGTLVLVTLLLVGPWYVWLITRFGIQETLAATPVTRMDPAATFGPLPLLGSLGRNVLGSAVPVSLFRTFLFGPRSFAAVYEGLTVLYFSLLPGALTLSLLAFLLDRFVKSWEAIRRRGFRSALGDPERSCLWIFILVGGLGALVLHPLAFLHGSAHSAFFPSVVALALLGWGLIARTPAPWAIVVSSGMVIEGMAMLWSHLQLVATFPPLRQDPNWTLKAEQQLIFLSDCLLSGRSLIMTVMVLIELAFSALLLRQLSKKDLPV